MNKISCLDENETLWDMVKSSPYYPNASSNFCKRAISLIGASHLFLAFNLNRGDGRPRFSKTVSLCCLIILAQPVREFLSIMKCWERQNATIDVNDKQVALIIEGQNTCNSFNKRWSIIKNLEKAGYQPLFKKISTLDDFCSLVHEVDRRKQIGVLWIHAHGSSRHLSLSSGEEISEETLSSHWELKRAFRSISEGGALILESCEAAEEEDGAVPIAKKIVRHMASGTRVFASCSVMNSLNILFMSLVPLEVGFLPGFPTHFFWLHLFKFGTINAGKTFKRDADSKTP